VSVKRFRIAEDGTRIQVPATPGVFSHTLSANDKDGGDLEHSRNFGTMLTGQMGVKRGEPRILTNAEGKKIKVVVKTVSRSRKNKHKNAVDNEKNDQKIGEPAQPIVIQNLVHKREHSYSED